jgi:hypothetical protein
MRLSMIFRWQEISETMLQRELLEAHNQSGIINLAALPPLPQRVTYFREEIFKFV